MNRTFRITVLFIAAAIGARSAFAEATVEGRVTLPKPKAPVANKRYSIAAKGGTAPVTPMLAVVYLKGSGPAPTGAMPTQRVLQKGMAFEPELLPVQVGTRVEFPNADEVEHSVYATSGPKPFNLGRIEPAQKPVPSQVFDTPGLVAIHCDIHENMRGNILVLDTPYFVLTDADGHFRLTGLPAGQQTVTVWVGGKTREQTINLTDGAVAKVDFP